MVLTRVTGYSVSCDPRPSALVFMPTTGRFSLQTRVWCVQGTEDHIYFLIRPENLTGHRIECNIRTSGNNLRCLYFV